MTPSSRLFCSLPRRVATWVTLASLAVLTACGGGAEPEAASVPQTIDFSAPGNQVYGSPALRLTATASSGLGVRFVSDTPAVCTVGGSTLILVGTGTCTVTAEQDGDALYAPATPVTASFDVAPAAQSISFVSPGNQSLGSAPVALVASATSGLPVAFAAITPAVCAVDDDRLLLLAAGRCTVEASQPGNTLYAAATVVSHSFDVAADLLPQSLQFTSPGDQTLGTAPAALAATATSGLPVSFSSLTTGVCTVAGDVLTLVSAGTCTVAASQAGDATFAAATAVQVSFAVSPAPQTISFTSPGLQTLGTTPPALVASATSGLPVSLAGTTPAVCTVSGSTLTLVAVGTCTVEASQAGNAGFAPAPTVVRSFAVDKATQTISFPSPGSQTLGTAPSELIATVTSGLTVSFASGTPAVCTVNGSTLTLVSAGTCTVTASQAGNDSVAAATPVVRSFVVSTAPLTAQSISFTAPGPQTLGTPPPALVATATSNLTISFESTTPAVCTVSGSTLTLVSAGTCTVTASQAGDATYEAATPVSRSFTVATSPLTAQSISFATPANQTLGAGPVALSATATSGLTVSITSTTAAVCTVSGSTLALVSAGTCTLQANQAGNTTFAAAPMVSVSFTVAQATQIINFASPGNQTLGAGPVALSATATSGLTVSLASTTPAVCTVNGSTLSLVALGSCSVTASQAGNAQFAAAATVTRSFNVVAAPLTAQSITFASPGNQILGGGTVALSATATSGLTVSFSSTTPAVCTVSGGTLSLVSAGTCTVHADQAGDATYAAALTKTVSFTVSQAGQSISFTGPGPQAFGSGPVALTGTATSGLTVDFTSVTPAVCTVSGSTLTLVAAGTCTVRAEQAGDATYAAAPSVTASFAVTQATQSIVFTGPGTQTFGSGPVALVATATSGLTVSFASTTPAVCTVSGSTLTLLSGGNCTVQASQTGDANYTAAVPVSVTFAVSQAGQSISFTSPGNQTLGSGTVALAATATSGLTVSFSSDTPAVCTVVGSTLTLVSAGTCTVVASQAGNASFLPAQQARSFSVSKAAQTISFAGPGDQEVGAAPLQLTATATSGEGVSFGSTTPAICTVAGTTLTLVAAGTCTLTANQAGTATYAAAPTVTVSITVAPYNFFANGGFEEEGDLPPPAEAWLAAASGYTRSTDARSGTYAAQLRSPAFSAAIMLQNSAEQGARDPLVAGTSPTLRFWAKGTAGATGSLNFALRYLDAVGNILANSQNQNFGGQINTSTWTEITFNLGVVPAGAAAAFIEFSQGIGPIGTGPAGEDWFEGLVLIDDLTLRVEP